MCLDKISVGWPLAVRLASFQIQDDRQDARRTICNHNFIISFEVSITEWQC